VPRAWQTPPATAMMPSSQQIHDKVVSVRQSKLRQRGRRLVGLAPLHESSATDGCLVSSVVKHWAVPASTAG